MFPAAGRTYFLAITDFGPSYLWGTDGTPQGTECLFRSSSTNTTFGERFRGANVGASFVFSAKDFTHGDELWSTNGTSGSTKLLVDIDSSNLGGSYPSRLKAAGSRLYFTVRAGSDLELWTNELWTSDGTEAGTVRVSEIHDSEFDGGVRDFADLGGRLLYISRGGLWLTDGTEAGTIRLTTQGVGVRASSSGGGLHAIGNMVFLAASDPDHGWELWVSDGTPQGTRMIVDLEPGSRGSDPVNFTAALGRLFFTAEAEDNGRELWSTDGTAAGTRLVKDIDARRGAGSNPRLLTEHAGQLYFFAGDDDHGSELWKTDGTAGGTVLAVDIVPGPESFEVAYLISSGSRLFLSGGSNAQGFGLWVSDGTAAGTGRISDEKVEAGSRTISHIVFKDSLYFQAAQTGFLWRSDGTPAGTVPLVDQDGLAILNPRAFQVFADRFFFAANRGDQGWLFQSNGTPEGTTTVDQLSRVFSSTTYELAPVGSRLFFRKWHPQSGVELWALDAE
jgi:ELWxxDGT repeat protein